MKFDDWWGAYPTQEDHEANCMDAWEAGAASRDAEVAELREDRDTWKARAEFSYEQRDKLTKQVKLLRIKLVKAADFIQPYNIASDLLEELDEALASTEATSTPTDI